VAEISSFQLETIDRFHPNISAVLNITPDHLNRHHTMENYIRAKLNIARNQTAEDVCVLNYEDEILRGRADTLRAKIVWFSSARVLKEGYYLDGDMICCAENGNVSRIVETTELNILGRHNHENAMAAAAMAHAAGVSFDTIAAVLRSFQAVEHRIEYVTEKRGIRFYNDSKGTNPDAAIKGIQAMDRPTLLIAGGYDKQSDYKEWIRSFDGKVKKLVLLGQTAKKIAQEAKELGFTDYVFADSLQEAVDICYQTAENGDTVLLSPACASWGMFPNYEVRGRMFKEMVHALKE
jgi:UDP-N-acetylmuramoylalanine--D-glutamate ligase